MVTPSAPPLVSILINNYNYGRFLGDAIDSALAQTYEHCEVIVVDDGSTDDSPDIIRSYGDRIIPILKANGGQASAFNAGFERSQGDILCFLDADDTFRPRKAARIVALFAAEDNAQLDHQPERKSGRKLGQKLDWGWCFHPIERVNSELKPMDWDESNWGKDGIYDLRSRLAKGKLGNATPFDCLVTSGMCFTRAMLSQLLPMPTEIKITSDDYLKYAALGTSRGYMLMEKLACQRLHGNNAYTGRSEKQALQGKIILQTAYFLKRDFPIVGAFADNLYALGLAKLSKHPLDDPALDRLIADYAAVLAPLTTLKVNAKKTYYRYRAK